MRPADVLSPETSRTSSALDESCSSSYAESANANTNGAAAGTAVSEVEWCAWRSSRHLARALWNAGRALSPCGCVSQGWAGNDNAADASSPTPSRQQHRPRHPLGLGGVSRLIGGPAQGLSVPAPLGGLAWRAPIPNHALRQRASRTPPNHVFPAPVACAHAFAGIHARHLCT